jgi:hypothetical protein
MRGSELRMANEAKNEGDPTFPVAGMRGEPASVEAKPVTGKLSYSPPKLKSLGKVAELTFGGGATAGDGLRTKKK